MASKRRQGGKGKPFQKGQPELPGKRFELGESGNPGGRPVAMKEVRERIQTWGLEMADVLHDIFSAKPQLKGKAVVGPSHRERILAIKELYDRGYGRSVQAVEISGPGGGALEHRDISLMNSAERRQRMQELLAKAGAGGAADAAGDLEEETADDGQADEGEDDDDGSGGR